MRGFENIDFPPPLTKEGGGGFAVLCLFARQIPLFPPLPKGEIDSQLPHWEDFLPGRVYLHVIIDFYNDYHLHPRVHDVLHDLNCRGGTRVRPSWFFRGFNC